MLKINLNSIPPTVSAVKWKEKCLNVWLAEGTEVGFYFRLKSIRLHAFLISNTENKENLPPFKKIKNIIRLCIYLVLRGGFLVARLKKTMDSENQKTLNWRKDSSYDFK